MRDQRLADFRRNFSWILIPVVLLAIGAFRPWHGLWSRIDHLGGDALLALHAQHRLPPQDVVLIDIDQASLDHPQMLELAGNWPWPRLVHGELVSYLAQQQARAVLFDVMFSEPDVFRTESDAAFASAIKNSPIPVYLPFVVAADGAASRLADLPPVMGIAPGANAAPDARLPLLAPKALPPELWRTGMINFNEDDDQRGRRLELFREYQGWRLPHMVGRTAHELGMVVPDQPSIPLHWYAKPFLHIPYHTLYLKSLSSDTGVDARLAGKIIIVGSTAPGLGDFHPTPMDARTPGPEIMATALANLKHQDWLRPVSNIWSILLATLMVFGTALGYQRGRHPSLILAIAVAITVMAVVAAYLLLDRNLQWLPFSALALGWLAQIGHGAAAYLRERRRRKETTDLFGRFLDPNVVRQLTDLNASAEARVGRTQQITILFSDIRGFTTLSETHRAEEIVELLNRYFDLQVEAIFDHGGTLDKFIGDAIMAFWGAPVEMPDHAVAAVEAALVMSDRLEAFRKELAFPFEIGIGIHTGEAVVGFIGAKKRLDYTAIGDTVNLGSRIEGKTAGISRILVSESTREACGERFEFIYHGEFAVKGRSQPVKLYEPRRQTS
ncbi:adenylate cyclase [Novimethylophilus kurashikiensis]|uniref:Adenylate cyclase n=1 Tax=Novimethylophilus kurashikiensis TaxID=1825523 RepID=A0A2R5F915_9PROT|nr:adenylate/guanylate cyclase domain-containing protein [Novimethylophilus kurashikiensis]GBG14730.1 adenylate cyclase [Novimethylophilus kurashikiensis]